MRLAAHELQDLNELTLSCVNSITSMGMFLNHAQDIELRAMITRHYPYHIRDYNKKVEYLQAAQGSQAPFPVPELNANLESFTQTPVPPAPPVTPRTNAQTLNDREIASSYLLNLKRAGREYAWAAMEMTHPEVRSIRPRRPTCRPSPACTAWYPSRPRPTWSCKAAGYQGDSQVSKPKRTGLSATKWGSPWMIPRRTKNLTGSLIEHGLSASVRFFLC